MAVRGRVTFDFLLFAVLLAVLVKIAWKRNTYDDRKGFVKLESNRAKV